MTLNNINIVLYVRSFSATSRPMIDRETTSFSCTCTRSYWDSLKSDIAGSAGRFLSTEDQRALLILDDLTKNHDVSAKIIDVGASILKRLKFVLKGISRTPKFVVNGKEITGVTHAQQLV
ncbi:MAG: hypothetical protein ACFE9D_06115 [Promethearchaeota archaeon]